MSYQAEAFRCKTCVWGRHCDESNPAPFAKWVIRGVIESRTCLLPMITEQTRFLLRQYAHYKSRVLPYAGGMLEQPNYYAEAMEIIAVHDAQLQAELAEKQRRELQRLSGERHG